MLDEVALVYHRKQFSALTEIAKHPVLSRRVKSLSFQADRLRTDITYEQWDKQRPDPAGMGLITPWDAEPRLERETGDRTIRRMRRALVRSEQERRERKDAVPLEQVANAYAAFLRTVQDQGFVEREGYDIACLRDFLKGCPRLRDVTICFEASRDGRPQAINTAFEAGLVRPYGDKVWNEQGVRALNAVAAAAYGSGSSLDSLTLENVSPRIIPDLNSSDMGINAEHPDNLDCQLRALIKPLRRLRFVLSAANPDYNAVGDEYALLEEQSDLLKAGGLYRLLKDATELRVVKFSFQAEVLEAESTFMSMDHAHVFRDLTFPHLYELRLSNCLMSMEYLLDLLLRHKDTLRRLSISYAQLSTGDWHTCFAEIGGKLTALKSVKLRGESECEFFTQFDFAVPEQRKPYYYRDAVERYVLIGGEWPDPEDYSDPGDTTDPLDQEEYELPAPTDREGRAEDDLANVYEWDSVDGCI